jgi:hypothetical protein
VTNDERKAIERARDTLGTLTPATPRDDAIAFELRYASRHLAGAQAKSIPSEAALNVLRAAALNALSAVAVSLDRRALTQDRIDKAQQAVAAALNQLPLEPRPKATLRFRSRAARSRRR